MVVFFAFLLCGKVLFFSHFSIEKHFEAVQRDSGLEAIMTLPSGNTARTFKCGKEVSASALAIILSSKLEGKTRSNMESPQEAQDKHILTHLLSGRWSENTGDEWPNSVTLATEAGCKTASTATPLR